MYFLLNFKVLYQEGRVWIPLTVLTLPHFCACPKSGLGFPTSSVMVFFYVQWVAEVTIVGFVHIGVVVDHHCLNFLFMIPHEMLLCYKLYWFPLNHFWWKINFPKMYVIANWVMQAYGITVLVVEVRVMVFNATFNKIQLYRGSQFHWWRKPEYCKSLTNSIT